VGGRLASALSGREVRYGDIRLGVVVDVLFDVDLRVALGFDVRCGDEAHRFLPMRACDFRGDHAMVESPFLLMEDGYYRTRGRSLSALRGAPVLETGRQAGHLADVILGEGGIATTLVVASMDGEREVPLGGGVAVGANPLARAV
jgi:hypothetical protein